MKKERDSGVPAVCRRVAVRLDREGGEVLEVLRTVEGDRISGLWGC